MNQILTINKILSTLSKKDCTRIALESLRLYLYNKYSKYIQESHDSPKEIRFQLNNGETVVFSCIFKESDLTIEYELYYRGFRRDKSEFEEILKNISIKEEQQ